MRLLPHRDLQLTYCTNIHAADGWPAVYANVQRYGPALKARFSPHAPFGIGLRLGARDARELAAAGVGTLRAFLDEHGLYVAVINGFPYGPFHGTPVKAEVYAPDWRDESRVAYTLDLAEIVRALVPAGMDAGVSTAPLSYKAWMPATARDGWMAATRNVARVAERLARIREADGTRIHLDIEPEPDCVLENTHETVAFFEDWLLPHGGALLAASLGITRSRAHDLLLEHVRVCFDCCHFAVEFENPVDAIERLARAGIRIGRVQLSSALRVPLGAGQRTLALSARLRPFADSTYLHQVIARDEGLLRHYPDLNVALDDLEASRHPGTGEWRIHFHVPLFTETYDGLDSTQSVVRSVLQAACRTPFTTHLEIETYTWDVLPAALKIDLLESIAREYQWVLGVVGGP